ncbi:MAG TPA: dihydrodipicolinate reductase C-terminal domain-containing protein [Candidatus Polarisedimenticolaceae bacterium]|nr:dihydrodipicolinate reductase C-terminal domain-containing protein [Candidatus Polarisedimenticolaceae bacterium]
MKYALVGHGRMGRAVDAAAAARGHVRALVVSRSGRGRGVARSIEAAAWRGVGVAFEFTHADAALDNVLALLARGIPVVCGSTGWDASDPRLGRAARASRAGAVLAPNFSIAMNLFYALVEQAARRFGALDAFDPWIAEWHHRAKRDAPSGTARRLAAILGPGVPVAAVRAGHEPGRHVVGFDGPDDLVTLSHAARGRSGFATGAVVAAEWLRGRRGLHAFDEVIEDLVRRPRRKGGRR